MEFRESSPIANMKSKYLLSALVLISSTFCLEPEEELLPDNFEETIDDVDEEPVTVMEEEEEDVTMTTPITTPIMRTTPSTPIMRTTTISVVSDRVDVVDSSELASARENNFGESGLEVNEIDVSAEAISKETSVQVQTETTPQEIATTELKRTEIQKPRYISNGWFLFPDDSIHEAGNSLYKTVQSFPAATKPVLPLKTSFFSYPWQHFPQKWASQPYSNEVSSNNLFKYSNNFPFKYPYVYYSLNINNQNTV